MSRNSIEINFADGEYTFALPLPQIGELQTKCGIGIGGLFQRLMKGATEMPQFVDGNHVGNRMFFDIGNAEFHALDIVETIRQGLIGGKQGIVNGTEVKVTPLLAQRLIDNYVLTAPLGDHWSLAAAILGTCLKGYDPPKKDEPAEKRAPETTTEA